MIKIENTRTLNKQSKLKDRHIEYIKQFWYYNTGRYYTLSTIKLNLLKEFPNLGNIWLSTISKWLKAKLNMSFKKLNKINFKMQHPENIQLILESMMLQIYHEKKELQNYLCEWVLNTTLIQATTICGERKEKIDIYINIDLNLIWVLCLFLSMEKIEGIMGTYSTFSAKWFEYFIINQFKNRKENCIIIMDNSKIHVAKIIDEYWKKIIKLYCSLFLPIACSSIYERS